MAKKDGTTVDITIGEKEDDPVLVISDLLIHLAGEQMEKKASVVIEGEVLDVLVGSRPLVGEEKEEEKKEKDLVKAMILRYLKDNYDMEEEDFLSAELEVVPAGKARDCGLDRSMILAYGQDDRICAFTSLFAIFEYFRKTSHLLSEHFTVHRLILYIMLSDIPAHPLDLFQILFLFF